MPDGGAAAGGAAVGAGALKDVTVVVPAHNAAETLPACLDALSGAVESGATLLVADDASSDATPRIAAASGAAVIRTGDEPVGPGLARNLAVEACRTEFIVFVDSDVVVRPDTVERLVAPLRSNREVVATFGSYDDDPPARTVAALYANLRHHDVHQRGPRDAETFWAGCGAVRRGAFLEVGGFSAAYARPSIEDIELGMRLRQTGGAIRLVPEAQCTHLKQWTVKQLWSTDVWRRAVPWSRLIVGGAGLDAGLNLDVGQRVSAIACHAAIASAAATLVFGWPSFIVTAVASIISMILNRSLLRLLFRRGGIGGLLGGGTLHFIYYLYSSVTFASVSLANVFWRGGGEAGRAAAVTAWLTAAVPFAAACVMTAVAMTPVERIVSAAERIDTKTAAEYFSADRVEQIRSRAVVAGLFF